MFRMRRSFPDAASSMIAFCNSSVSSSPKKFPFGYSTTTVRIDFRRTATSLPFRHSDRFGLREARDGLLLVRIDVEHQRQLGDDKDVLDALVDRAQLHLPAPAHVVRMRANQHAQRGRVQVLGLREVDDQRLVAGLTERLDCLVELVGLVTAREVALWREDLDVSDLALLHRTLPIWARER